MKERETKQNVIALFENIVSLFPQKLALTYGNYEITYHELNKTVNRFSHYLLQGGLKKGDLVSIVMQRSFEAIVSILAVLKCGAAYIPVDSNYPEERVAFMLDDADAGFVITNVDSENDFSDNVKKIVIEDALITAGDFPDSNPGIVIDTNDLMYILYTSGSTGKPKGAMIAHKNIVHFLNGMQDVFNISPESTMVTVYSISFDPSGGDYFMALTNGATLVIADAETVKDGSRLLDLLVSKKITYLKATPSIYKLLLDGGWKNKLDITILSGGEVLPASLAKMLLPLCNELYNVYGPTETAINASQIRITAGDNITIGYPLLATFAYVLDEKLNRLEKGQPGELYIGGNGVGLGYYKREELTNERFLPDPFSLLPGAKMYKTGDLVKVDEQNRIVYLGRVDNQVKIRGYRIELGEIEHHISQLADVAEVIVRAQQNNQGENILVANIVLRNEDRSTNQAALISGWKQQLQQSLPVFMVPSYFFILEKWPLLPNGKINYNALPSLPSKRPELTVMYNPPADKTEKELVDVWSEVLGISGIGIDDNFFELGGNSLLAQRTVSAAKIKCDYSIPITKLYQYPTIAGLKSFLSGNEKYTKPRTKLKNTLIQKKDIAIIGLECNFPGAATIDEFWNILKEGKETTSFFTNDELDAAVPDEIKNDPNYIKARGILKDVELFDAAFFGINPKLAELMDPQHRLFLEGARNILEKTGYLPEKKENVIGVFVGCSNSTYFNNNVIWHKDKVAQQGRFSMLSITDKDYISTRTAYHLNLNGPAVNVNAACSTALLAVVQAVESLRSGQCHLAIAGGAAIHVPVKSGHLYEEGAVSSADGHCRPFDEKATGTLFSDGVGAVLLKPLEDAQRDGDIIYAVIKGVGINNDGANKGSFSAPSAEGQSGAISMAINDAQVNPADIGYVEAHGTATPLGDPIEIEGLKMAFGVQQKKQYCSIGSVKSNFGHLVHAAGAAGLIKTALALHYKKIPASLYFNKPNPAIDFANSPFIVNNTLKDWITDNRRIAGVSAFGIGGTNVHIIVEEYNGTDNSVENKSTDSPVLITWSARNEDSCALYADKLLQYAEASPGINIRDIAFTLQTTRPDLAVRNSLVASETSELITQLSQREKVASSVIAVKEKNRNLVFMFPGQGSQYVNMGLGLYRAEQVFKAAVDECAGILLQATGVDIRDVIFSEKGDAADQLKNTYYTQPAIFITSYAIAKLYLSWGVVPAAFVGHSVGEFVAAHLAGIFSLEDALKIVASRAKLISELPGGYMLSVRAAVSDVRPYLTDEISVAAVNAPNLCVLSGNYDVIEKLSSLLGEKGISNKLLRTSHAFHSAMMEPVVEPLQKIVATVQLHVPKIPILSTVTASWLKDSEATDPYYWAYHSRATVNFSGAVKAIENEMHPVFLEIGPGTTTATLAKQHGADIAKRSTSTLDAGNNFETENTAVKAALGRIWQNGIAVNWEQLYVNDIPRLLHNVPTYAYDRKKYWVEPPVNNMIASGVSDNSFVEPDNNNEPVNTMNRKELLVDKIKSIFESASGIDITDTDPRSSFIEIGMDSLLLTQVATTLKKEFKTPITFRQLNEECDSVDKLASYLDAQLPSDSYQPNPITPAKKMIEHNFSSPASNNDGGVLDLIARQLSALAQQVSMLQGKAPENGPSIAAVPTNGIVKDTDELTAEEKVELKKPFGATAKIDTKTIGITNEQNEYLKNLLTVYINKTIKSKNYTQEHRAYMADPRVVSGFKPLTKEMVYSIVIKKSKGCYLWDIDDNKYIDALNGFGSNFLGYQADILKNALIEQVEKGYEIGPQHELAGEVAKLICEFTGFDRAGLCNTGSEAVLGAMRIARTVSGKNIIVAFTGSYHGITDEVLVRGTKKLKTFPAAPGILKENVQNMLILEYGSEEALQIIQQRSDEIAAVLVEPVQSRRPEFRPVEFLKTLRTVTEKNDIALVFDEVITGFRSHPGGAQALFGIKADIGTYGKVVGGGLSIGIIAGRKKYMDALDGGYWQYGDDSKPEAGVTYFAGTFVRHPLVLATAKASLNYFKQQGPALQQGLNDKTSNLVEKLNLVCSRYSVPIFVAHFASLYRIKFLEEYPYSELLFTLMRYKGIHILDGFPCFLTAAHTEEDLSQIETVFEESIAELCKVGFIPQKSKPFENNAGTLHVIDSNQPPMPGAQLGKDPDGNAAWFIADENNKGKFLQIETT